MSTTVSQKEIFRKVVDGLFAIAKPGEFLLVNLVAEESEFVRFNGGKIRQTGAVVDGELHCRLISNGRTITFVAPFQNDIDRNLSVAVQAFSGARQAIGALPEDPYAVIPSGVQVSEENNDGKLLESESLPKAILEPVSGLDFVGLYSAGTIVRASASSHGQFHWFSTRNFVLDYSVCLSNGHAVKSTYAGRDWHSAVFAEQVADVRKQLSSLSQPERTLSPGRYRCYLAPAALHDIIDMLGSGLGEGSFRQGESPFIPMRDKGQKLSPHFSFLEDFSTGMAPRFNDDGELAPERLPLIHKGVLTNTLVSLRSAKEYGVLANGASNHEYSRSPVVGAGSLANADIFKALDCGLFLSNLHYLNWSDLPAGRMTGMTRHACFWVENGRLVAPINAMRFDDTFYNILGDSLEEVSASRVLVPATSTYEHRDVGGCLLPGVLLKEFAFTL